MAAVEAADAGAASVAFKTTSRQFIAPALKALVAKVLRSVCSVDRTSTSCSTCEQSVCCVWGSASVTAIGRESTGTTWDKCVSNRRAGAGGWEGRRRQAKVRTDRTGKLAEFRLRNVCPFFLFRTAYKGASSLLSGVEHPTSQGIY